MGKKIDNKKTNATPSTKKKIQRQNTMEKTADEGLAFVKSLDKILKRKQEEKKEQKAKELKEQQSKKESKKETPKAKAPAKGKKAVSKAKNDATPAKKKATPTKKEVKHLGIMQAKRGGVKVKKDDDNPKKAKAPAKTTTKKSKTEKPAVVATPAPSTSLFSSGLFPSSAVTKDAGTGNSKYPALINNDVNSCSKIASTEVIHDAKLGYQIIKKSLKGQPKAEEVKGDKKKAKPLRTKTGDRLAAGMVDIVFCCDTTSSMSSYLTQCKNTVQEIIKKIIEKTSGEGISVKFGFVAYRDHPPQDCSYLTCSYDLTSEEEIKEFIQSLTAYGGGDLPEAVMDGLYVSAKHMSWRDSTHIPSLRYIFHITDAPPHGQEYNNSSFFGSKVGPCLCNLDINKVSHIINMKQIHYRLISAEQNSTKNMAEIFKEKIVDYEECGINKASEMDIKISDMIIRELLPDMVEEEI